MYRKSFPKCEVAGSREPVKYGHMASFGALPKKCTTCSNLFEGECTRGLDETGSLLRLDYEACDKPGPTTPVEIEVIDEHSIYVPHKCQNCEYLIKTEIRGYACSYEQEQWQDFPRDLDWGDWQPDYPLVGLRRYRKGKYSMEDLGPAIVNKELTLLLMNNETAKAVKLYRRLNKIETLKEALDDVNTLASKLRN